MGQFFYLPYISFIPKIDFFDRENFSLELFKDVHYIYLYPTRLLGAETGGQDGVNFEFVTVAGLVLLVEDANP